MAVLILGDSHLARARPRHAEIAAATTSRAVGGSTVLDLDDQLAGIDLAAYDVVVVSLGTNDAGWRDVPLTQFVSVLDAALARLAGRRLVFVTSPGCDPARAGGCSADRLAAYATSATGLVTGHGGIVVDSPAVLATLGAAAFLEDGFHLTQPAYDLLLPAIATAVAG